MEILECLFRIILIVLLSAVVGDCCNRRTTNSEIPKTSDTSTLAVTANSTASPTNKLPCDIEERKSTKCLQGDCYAVLIGTERRTACDCPSGFRGKRCEENIVDECSQSRGAQFGIFVVIGLIFTVVIIGGVIIVLYIYHRKQKQLVERSQQENNRSGQPLLINPPVTV